MYVSVRMWLHVCARMRRICSRQHLVLGIHPNITNSQVLQKYIKQQVVSLAASNGDNQSAEAANLQTYERQMNYLH